MSLRGKRDIQATAAAKFYSQHSFIRLGDGADILSGKDWKIRRQECAERDDYRCRYCGRDIAGNFADPHHVVPRGNGGSDNMDNLRTLCRDCHNLKHPEKQVQWTKKTQAAEEFEKLYKEKKDAAK
jgi:5-methylcytosine-specific restriction endonuclease McrA